MDKKDLYMTVGELLKSYTPEDINNAIDGIVKLYNAEGVMGNKIKQLNKHKENINAIGKKKT
jgi:hypothetical protein